MKMICPNCGKEYNEKMTCCISCGADLVPAEKETTYESETDLQQETESLIRPLISEPVYVSAGSAVSFDRDEFIVPLKKRSVGVSLSDAAKFVGSLVTALIMLALIIASASAAGFRLLTDEKKIAEFAHQLDVMALPAASFTDNGSGTVQDAVCAMSQGTGLTRENIRTIYEESTAKDFLAARLTDYAEYIRNGTTPEKITTEQLKDVFEENVPLIGNTMGYPLNEQDVALACSEIERTKPLLEVLSCENLEQTIGRNTLVAVRLFSSAPAVAVTAALAAAMLAVLRAVNKKNTVTLNWSGGTILAGGAIVLAATFLFSAQLPYSNADKIVRDVLKCACDVISPDMYRIGATLAVVGAVMLIWAESLKKSAAVK